MARSSWAFTECEEIASGRRCVRLLGGGELYEVYLARDDALHALVVVKILRPVLVGRPDAEEALAREARALARLSHPAIVRAFDAVVDGRRPHLALEFVEGPRLSTLLARYGLAVEHVLPLALHVCAALHYMSGRGVVHLDVCPRNLIVSAQPRLIDLGLSRTTSEPPTGAELARAGAYAAPERCDPGRFGAVGPPADVWALGVTIYEALARSLPFPPASRPNGSAGTWFPQLSADPLPLPDRVPAAVRRSVLSCLERDPADRPTARELAGELEPLVATYRPRPHLTLVRTQPARALRSSA